jgi:hypothetical protein
MPFDLQQLDYWIDDERKEFGHSICLAYTLLCDLKNFKQSNIN